MKVAEKDVLYVAALANLELSQDERQSMLRDLNAILNYVDLLNQLDTAGVTPTLQVAEPIGTEQNHQAVQMREDELYGLRPSLSQDTALANAPASDRSFFLVPQVIERS